MGEDKKQEEFLRWSTAGRKLGTMELLFAEEAWNACAAIKDAEIAARDAVIKGLREDLLAIAQSAYMPPALVGIIKQRLANSEHHNSKALEKMLLEAELKILHDVFKSGKDDTAYIAEQFNKREAKLAELNKE